MHSSCKLDEGLRCIGTDDSHIRLVLTETGSIDVDYNTLSHRWGTNPFIQLTKDTMRTFQEGIDMPSLPKTFQDAIVVSRSIDIGYLWIDSLCIVQDDASDWQKEASLMHKIYSGAFCNIAATGANSGAEGLFLDRWIGGAHPTLIRLTTPSGVSATYELLSEGFWDFHISSDTQGPLNRRGWVLQERLFSRRILHFGRQQTLWQCNELCAAEQYPDGLPERLETVKHGKLKALRDPMASSEDAIPELGLLWLDLVKEYAECSLTRDEDKLIAISGLAQRMKALNNNIPYIAGLWERNILHQLLWRAYSKSGEEMETPVFSKYIAPSFSWANLDARIVFRKLPKSVTNIARLLSWTAILEVTGHATGQIKFASLQVEGFLRPVSVDETTTATTHASFSCSRTGSDQGRYLISLLHR